MKVLFKEGWTNSETKETVKENTASDIPKELFEHLVSAGVKVEEVKEPAKKTDGK